MYDKEYRGDKNSSEESYCRYDNMRAGDNFNWMSHYTKEMVVEKTAIAPETSIYTLQFHV